MNRHVYCHQAKVRPRRLLFRPRHFCQVAAPPRCLQRRTEVLSCFSHRRWPKAGPGPPRPGIGVNVSVLNKEEKLPEAITSLLPTWAKGKDPRMRTGSWRLVQTSEGSPA